VSYSIGLGSNQRATAEDKDLLTQEQLLKRLDYYISDLATKDKLPIEVQIKAHEKLPSGHVMRMRVELDKRDDKIAKVWAGVRDKGY
jgi:hypothetical protein